VSRIAVTGASGFVGGAITRRLVADGHDVVALGRRPAAIEGAIDATWDLADADGPPPRELERVDAVVHAAAHVAPWGSNEPFWAVTVRGTERLLAAARSGARLVVIGSASVYDPRIPHRLATEPEAPVAAHRYLNEYGRSKAAQERLVLAARPDAIVLRPRAVWGAGDPNLLPRLLERARLDRLLLPAGGRRPLSATHISTLVTAVASALERPNVRGPVNVADATPTSAATLATAVLTAMGRAVRIASIPGPLADLVARLGEAAWRALDRPGEPPVTRYAVAGLAHAFTLDLSRLHTELGIRPDVDLLAAAVEVAQALQAGPRRIDPAPKDNHSDRSDVIPPS